MWTIPIMQQNSTLSQLLGRTINHIAHGFTPFLGPTNIIILHSIRESYANGLI